ncbi:LpqU protein [Hoyosella subflava DQS3-9A1]|uniref:LpqU protein n=2 Tax=Hoyosella TaxID=697025 RepID=F6EQN9_HOYSD|nr:LpqU protein [Hoyosella subflava DQS3-9A1]
MAAASLPLAGAAAASAETLTDIAEAVLEAMPPAPGTGVPMIDYHAPGRTSDLLADWAQAHSDALGIPRPAMQAYGHAALVMQETQPGCGLRWTTLAGIGGIESWHGTYEGATILDDGRVEPPIRGVKLDGRPGLADIPDTDNGEMDGDPDHDRAMGPMQFIPETWRLFGTDGNGNGHADPDNIDDAVMSAARYLCAAGGNLESPEGWRKAILAYNQSEDYLLDVRDAAWRYSADVHVPEPAPAPEPALEPPPEPEPLPEALPEGELPPASEGELPPPPPEGELPPELPQGELPPEEHRDGHELAHSELHEGEPLEAEMHEPEVHEPEYPGAEHHEPEHPEAEHAEHHEPELPEAEHAEHAEHAPEHHDARGEAALRDIPEGEIDDEDLELLKEFAEQYGEGFEYDDELDDQRVPASERAPGHMVPDVLAKLAAEIWAFLAKLGINGEPKGGA